MADTLDRLLDLTQAVATPFAQRYAYGDPGATDAQANAERAYWARVNGSGPANTTAARQAPGSWMEQAFGKEIGPDGQVRMNWKAPAVLLVVLLLAWLAWKKS